VLRFGRVLTAAVRAGRCECVVLQGTYLAICIGRVTRGAAYRQYRDAEQKYAVSDYMHTQPQINATMRSILVDWMVDVREEFGLLESSMYLSIRLLDRLLHTVAVPRRELQLVGSACILVASKLEEVRPPTVDDLQYLCDGTYTHDQIRQMEGALLDKLQFAMHCPTVWSALEFFYAEFNSPNQFDQTAIYFANVSAQREHCCLSSAASDRVVVLSVVCVRYARRSRPAVRVGVVSGRLPSGVAAADVGGDRRGVFDTVHVRSSVQRSAGRVGLRAVRPEAARAADHGPPCAARGADHRPEDQPPAVPARYLRKLQREKAAPVRTHRLSLPLSLSVVCLLTRSAHCCGAWCVVVV
jgi:hypothetical protein